MFWLLHWSNHEKQVSSILNYTRRSAISREFNSENSFTLKVTLKKHIDKHCQHHIIESNLLQRTSNRLLSFCLLKKIQLFFVKAPINEKHLQFYVNRGRLRTNFYRSALKGGEPFDETDQWLWVGSSQAIFILLQKSDS